jgi:hypothetical protein
LNLSIAAHGECVNYVQYRRLSYPFTGFVAAGVLC